MAFILNFLYLNEKEATKTKYKAFAVTGIILLLAYLHKHMEYLFS